MLIAIFRKEFVGEFERCTVTVWKYNGHVPKNNHKIPYITFVATLKHKARKRTKKYDLVICQTLLRRPVVLPNSNCPESADTRMCSISPFSSHQRDKCDSNITLEISRSTSKWSQFSIAKTLEFGR